jgi:hypothetical protein
MLMGITIALAVGIYFIVSWRLGSQEVREFMSLMQQLFNPGRKAYRQNT